MINDQIIFNDSIISNKPVTCDVSDKTNKKIQLMDALKGVSYYSDTSYQDAIDLLDKIKFKINVFGVPTFYADGYSGGVRLWQIYRMAHRIMIHDPDCPREDRRKIKQIYKKILHLDSRCCFKIRRMGVFTKYIYKHMFWLINLIFKVNAPPNKRTIDLSKFVNTYSEIQFIEKYKHEPNKFFVNGVRICYKSYRKGMCKNFYRWKKPTRKQINDYERLKTIFTTFHNIPNADLMGTNNGIS
jgi:hypothetical protein